jgi:transcriptional regulator with XRE-family HTH domain
MSVKSRVKSPQSAEGKKSLADTIRRLRGDTSQQDFAHELDVAIVTVSRYEHGAAPELSVLRKLHELAFARKDWEARKTFRDEIEKRIGLDPSALLMAVGGPGPARVLMSVADMLTPAEEGLVIGLIRMLRNSSDQDELRALHTLLDRWALRVDEIADVRTLPKSKQRKGEQTRGENEHRVVNAVLQFLRDKKTSNRERRTLEALLGQHRQ